jgi:hypothetical protein
VPRGGLSVGVERLRVQMREPAPAEGCHQSTSFIRDASWSKLFLPLLILVELFAHLYEKMVIIRLLCTLYSPRSLTTA